MYSAPCRELDGLSHTLEIWCLGNEVIMPAEVLSSCETKSVVLQDLYGQLNIPTLLCVCCMNTPWTYHTCRFIGFPV